MAPQDMGSIHSGEYLVPERVCLAATTRQKWSKAWRHGSRRRTTLDAVDAVSAVVAEWPHLARLRPHWPLEVDHPLRRLPAAVVGHVQLAVAVVLSQVPAQRRLVVLLAFRID